MEMPTSCSNTWVWNPGGKLKLATGDLGIGDMTVARDENEEYSKGASMIPSEQIKIV